MKKEGVLILVSYHNEPMAWTVLLNTKGNSTLGEGELGKGGQGRRQGDQKALSQQSLLWNAYQSQPTTGLDAIQPAIQTGITHSKAECRAVAACL